MVYIIQGVDRITGELGKYVKIGYTSQDVSDRLNQLQTGNPDRLSVIRTMGGEMTLESRMHSYFSADRLDPKSEWFVFNEEMLTISPIDLGISPPMTKEEREAMIRKNKEDKRRRAFMETQKQDSTEIASKRRSASNHNDTKRLKYITKTTTTVTETWTEEYNTSNPTQSL